MRKLLPLIVAIVAAIFAQPALAGTCNSSYTDTLPQTSGTVGTVATSSPWTPPGQITALLATGDGFDVTYTPTSGSPVTQHISLGTNVTCAPDQVGGWAMPAPSNKLTRIKFEAGIHGAYSTTAVINNSTVPMNVFRCANVYIRGEYGITTGNGITKIAAGPGTQDLTFTGNDAMGIVTRKTRALGSCDFGLSYGPVTYPRYNEDTQSNGAAKVNMYGSGGISSVQFWIDGVSQGTDSTATTVGSHQEYSLTLSGIADGFRMVKGTATFTSGGTISWEERLFFSKLRVSGGQDFTCAVDDSSRVYCWGSNAYGQLGDGTTGGTRGTPSLAVTSGSIYPHYSNDLVYVADIATGNEASCAVAIGDANGDEVYSGGVFCWGLNSSGILGVSPGTLASSDEPVTVFPYDSGAVGVAVGQAHACALFANGQVKCWGYGSRGQLGNGCTISSGACSGSAAVTTPVANFSNAVQVGAGVDTTWVRTSAGEVWSYGRDNWGQLGDSATLANKSTPQLVIASGATEMWNGLYHSCARVSGVIKCWGSNPHGELANGATSTNQPTPVTATDTSPYTVVSMALGDSVTCMVMSNSAVYCRGYNGFGALGVGWTSTTEGWLMPSAYSSGVHRMSAGWSHLCAIDDGSVKCAGDNTYDQVHQSASNPQLSPYTVFGL